MTTYSSSHRAVFQLLHFRSSVDLYPCKEKYSLIEKQIDSSSSTTNKRGNGVSLKDFSSRPSHICRNLPETFLSVPNRLCFTGHTKTNNYTSKNLRGFLPEALCAAEARTSRD
jgi:hypothetical protein